MEKHWTVHATEKLYRGFFKLVRYRFSHSLFAGGRSAEIDREVLLRGPAAAVLIWDPALDKFLLVEQIRPGAFDQLNGPWLTEIVAGMVEAGEEPECVVRREALEEANVQLGDVVPMLQYMPSPGGSDERLFLFLGRADLKAAGGL
ncbi:MAG: NUDIX domain-containing protein, partial [Granulosicoccaceae bacterium]